MTDYSTTLFVDVFPTAKDRAGTTAASGSPTGRPAQSTSSNTTVRHELGHLAWSTDDMVAFDDRLYVDLYGFTDAGMVGQLRGL
jgi:hypothetical protein